MRKKILIQVVPSLFVIRVLALLTFIISFTFILSCRFKSKNELYMERGLDILSNKIKVDFSLSNDLIIEEIGVIRDKKTNKKTLIFKLPDSLEVGSTADCVVGVKAKIRDQKKRLRTEKWDFHLKIMEIGGHKYVIRDIKVSEDKIQDLTVYLYRWVEGEKQYFGETLTVKKLHTYND